MDEVGLLAFETPKEKARREGRALMVERCDASSAGM